MPEFKSNNRTLAKTTPAETTTLVKEEPSLFAKTHRFFDPAGDYAQVKNADLYPYFHPIERNEGTRAILNGRELIMAGSNNYLGLTSDPRVKEAAMRRHQTVWHGMYGQPLSQWHARSSP